MYLNTSTKTLLLRLTVTKLGIAHNLDVKALSPSNVANSRENKGTESYSIALPGSKRNVKQNENTPCSKPAIKCAKPHRQIQSLKLEFLNSTAKKAKLVPGHYL
ncbi:hypothetical protein A2U01_0066141, partial [Trifolium medium]|nr:hypothetical protein [Trifolium medium]